jgi:hypothetical protein
MVSRRGTSPAGPQPIPVTCLGVPAWDFTILSFLASSITRNGTRLSGSNDDLIGMAPSLGGALPVRFVVEGTLVDTSLQLSVRSTSPGFDHREDWTATVRSQGSTGVIEGTSSGRFALNECVSTWSGEPFVAQIVPWGDGGGGAVPPGNVVLTEFRTRGPAGGNDEFIEIRNETAASVALGGWRLDASTAAGAVSTLHVLPSGLTLAPGCHYLVVNRASGGYTGPVAPDGAFTAGVDDNGGIALRRPDGTAVDAVGMSGGSAFREGTPLPPMDASNADRSYQRVADIDNNALDFVLGAPSTPTNRSGSCAAR